MPNEILEESEQLTKAKLINRMILHNEQIFYTTGHLPTNSEVEEFFSRELRSLQLEYFDVLASVTKELQKSNLIEQDFNNLLDPKQFLVAQMLLSTSDRRSIRQKLKEIGVTTREFENWRRTPRFMRYIREESERRFGDADVAANLELVKHVEDGNLDAIKYFHQITGRFTSPEAVNVAKVLAVMMEILVQYVAPEILSKVAKEMETKIYQNLMGAQRAIEADSSEMTPMMEIKFDH